VEFGAYALLHESFRLETLARFSGLSASQVNRIFHAEFSTAPKRYFEQRRLDAALSALRNLDFPPGAGNTRGATPWRSAARSFENY